LTDREILGEEDSSDFEVFLVAVFHEWHPL
jgi:hypothetical protein